MPCVPFKAGDIEGFLCTRGRRKPVARQVLEQPARPRALSLYCSVRGCGAVAPLPCEGRPEGQPCTTTVCGQHRAPGRRWLCSSCGRPEAAPAPQPQQLSLISGVTP